MVRFIENLLLFNQLNIARVDIPFVLENDIGETARLTQPVTLYITVNITPPIPYNHMPQSRENASPPEDFLFALDRADEAMKLIVPIDRSTTWERAVQNINWVMDTLSPIAEVRAMPFCILDWADFPHSGFPICKDGARFTRSHPQGTLIFVIFRKECSWYIRLDGRRSWNSINETTMSEPWSKPCMTR